MLRANLSPIRGPLVVFQRCPCSKHCNAPYRHHWRPICYVSAGRQHIVKVLGEYSASHWYKKENEMFIAKMNPWLQWLLNLSMTWQRKIDRKENAKNATHVYFLL